MSIAAKHTLTGFPCQAFSIAGYREGFNDERGNLFFYIRDIIRKKQPISFFLENVDNLITHDKGRTFSIINNILESELKYYIRYKILNAMDFGLPQRRKRIFIVGYKKNLRFEFPKGDSGNPMVDDILETKLVDEKYYLSQQLLNTLKNHRTRHKAKGHGFGYQVIGRKEVANTIVCGGMGKERNLVKDTIKYDGKLDEFLKIVELVLNKKPQNIDLEMKDQYRLKMDVIMLKYIGLNKKDVIILYNDLINLVKQREERATSIKREKKKKNNNKN